MAFRSAATYRLTAVQDDSTVGGNTPSKCLWFQYSSSCAGSARRTRREKAARAAVPGSRLSATIGAPSSQKRRLRRKMCATSSMPSAAVRAGCTTIASACSSGTAGAGRSNAIAVQRSMLARRISEEDREGRLDTGRGLLGAPIGKQILALEDDERPGLVSEAENADVDHRLWGRLAAQRVGERAGAREAGAKEQRAGDVWIAGQLGGQRPGRRPHQRPGVDLVPAPDGGEELADPQIDPVIPREVAEQPIGEEVPAFLVGVLLVDRVDLREEVHALQRIPDDEEVQALDPESRRATFLVEKVNRAVAGQGQSGVTDAQATAGRVGHVADARRQRQESALVGAGRQRVRARRGRR